MHVCLRTHTCTHLHKHSKKRMVQRKHAGQVGWPSKVSIQWRTWLLGYDEAGTENTLPQCSEYNHKTRWNRRLSEDIGNWLHHRTECSSYTERLPAEWRNMAASQLMLTFTEGAWWDPGMFIRLIYFCLISINLHICTCTMCIQCPQRPE